MRSSCRERRNEASPLAGADALHRLPDAADLLALEHVVQDHERDPRRLLVVPGRVHRGELRKDPDRPDLVQRLHQLDHLRAAERSEENTSELQSLMRTSYAV